MKRNILSNRIVKMWVLSLVILLNIQITFKANAANKYALIVGIGSQPTDTRWKSNHAREDALVMQKTLSARGFDSIIVLLDEHATKKALIAALKQAKTGLQPNDVFVFYYAGHGQKLADNNHEEADGYDEALVCYGAPSQYDQWYDDEHHLRDDDFSRYIDDIREKIGAFGQVLVLLDAGFGSESNATDTVRGGMAAMERERFGQLRAIQETQSSIYESRYYAFIPDDAAHIICISATVHNFAAMEVNQHGVFTQALQMVISSSPLGESYLQLFERLTLFIENLGVPQMPVMEGYYTDLHDLNKKQITKYSILTAII